MKYVICENSPWGLVTALIPWLKFGEGAQYWFISDGVKLPRILNGSEVYLLGRSVDWAFVKRLLVMGCRVMVVDHHESTLVDWLLRLPEFRDLGLKIDPSDFGLNDLMEWISRSGLSDRRQGIEDWLNHRNRQTLLVSEADLCVRLTRSTSSIMQLWREFFPDTALPDLIAYLDDWQCDRFEKPASDAVSLGFWKRLNECGDSEAPIQVKLHWLAYLMGCETFASTMADWGRVEAKAQQIAVLGICSAFKWEHIGDCYVPVVKSPPNLSAAVAREIHRRHAAVPFTATWSWTDGGQIAYLLRSSPRHQIRVNRVAEKYGGIGDANQAQFSMPVLSVASSA